MAGVHLVDPLIDSDDDDDRISSQDHELQVTSHRPSEIRVTSMMLGNPGWGAASSQDAYPASYQPYADRSGEGRGSLDAPLLAAGASDDHETTEDHAKRTGSWITWRDVRDWWFADGPVYLFYILWVAGMAAISLDALVVYWNSPNYFVTLARFGGSILKLNSALILLPVCRNALTYLRKIQFLHHFVPFDKNIAWHRHIGWSLLVFGVIHAMGHYLNYNETGQPWEFAWTTLAGSTGHLISIIMIFMYVTFNDHRILVERLNSPFSLSLSSFIDVILFVLKKVFISMA